MENNSFVLRFLATRDMMWLKMIAKQGDIHYGKNCPFYFVC